MSDVVIRAEGLGKAYQIRHEAERRHDRFSEMLAERARRLFRRDGEADPTRETFWALRDVSFEVREGEVVGIIGRNGAGKSTLLKILSRITEPTEGRVELRGRVASLLEVGTGFHPELTGRENVYLNGAILGMSRAEIRRKFDEIVDFAGVEKFLDTPVKRYSSGMRVRLAFAVAAHLEPEILVVDEVLAVGDAEFQRKCLGKMGEVAKGGRTVLFVSHNMTAVQRLCERVMVLKDGEIEHFLETELAIEQYALTSPIGRAVELAHISKRGGSGANRIRDFEILGECRTGCPASFRVRLSRRLWSERFRISILFSDMHLRETMIVSSELGPTPLTEAPGADTFDCHFSRLSLSPGLYSVTLFLECEGEVCDWLENEFSIDVADGNYYVAGASLPRGWRKQVVLVDHQWCVADASKERNEQRVLL